MERMGRDAVQTIKITARAMQQARRRLAQWALVLLLSLAAIAFALPRWQTAAAIGLALLAYNVITTDWGRYAGPYAGIATRLVRTQMLFIEDSGGRARAWLGVENEFDDETGARLVFYDEKGRARLALRFAGNAYMDEPGPGGARAEAVPFETVVESIAPAPFPPGKPPSDETKRKQRGEHAAHAAAVHIEVEARHATEWAGTHSAGRVKGADYESEDSDTEHPKLVIFDKTGRESVSLASELTLTGAKGFATVAAEEIFLMSDGKVVWEAPSPPRRAGEGGPAHTPPFGGL